MKTNTIDPRYLHGSTEIGWLECNHPTTEPTNMTQHHDTPRTDACPHCGSTTMHGHNLCGTENGNRTTECYLWEKLQKSESEVTFWKSKAYESEQSEGKHEAELSMWRDGGIMHSAHGNEIDELKAEVERLKAVTKEYDESFKEGVEVLSKAHTSS